MIAVLASFVMVPLANNDEDDVFISYSESGGFSNITTTIRVSSSGAFGGASGPLNNQLPASALTQLKAQARMVPTYSAGKFDAGGGCDMFYSIEVDGVGSSTWTSNSPDVPGRITQLVSLLKDLTSQHKQAKLVEVEKVNVELQKSNPPIMVITATGTGTTSACKGILTAYHYFAPPADGIWEFDLSGACSGQDVITPGGVTAKYEWKGFPIGQVRGIRIKGSNNTKKEFLFTTKS